MIGFLGFFLALSNPNKKLNFKEFFFNYQNVRKFLLATSNFGVEIQGELDMYVTKNKLNGASFRRNYDQISKNILKNKNPIELLV